MLISVDFWKSMHGFAIDSRNRVRLKSLYYQRQKYCSLSCLSNLSDLKTGRDKTKKHSITGRSVDRANISQMSISLYLFSFPSYESLKKCERVIPLTLMVLWAKFCQINKKK